MKLVNSQINYTIDFMENIVNVLVVENPDIMTELITNLWRQCNGADGSFVLSDDEELKIDKNMNIIINPFDIDFNSKKILSALFNSMSQRANDCIEQKTLINASIINVLDDILLHESYPGIEHSLDFSWIDVFKIYNVKIEQNHDTLIQKLIEYIKILVNYCGVRILCLVNIKSFLSDNEIKELYKYAGLSKMQLLLVESNEKEALSCENICIIDNDRCIINKSC